MENVWDYLRANKLSSLVWDIHVAHLVIDAGVDTEWVRERRRLAGRGEAGEGELMSPASIAETYWMLHGQTRDAWTHELDVRPFGERF